MPFAFRDCFNEKIHISFSILMFSFLRHTSNIQKRNTNTCLWLHSLFQQRKKTAIGFSSFIIRGIPKICFLIINQFPLVKTHHECPVTQGSWLIYALLWTKNIHYEKLPYQYSVFSDILQISKRGIQTHVFDIIIYFNKGLVRPNTFFFLIIRGNPKICFLIIN